MLVLVRGCRQLTSIGLGRCTGLTDQALVHVADNLERLKNVDLAGWTVDATMRASPGPISGK